MKPPLLADQTYSSRLILHCSTLSIRVFLTLKETQSWHLQFGLVTKLWLKSIFEKILHTASLKKHLLESDKSRKFTYICICIRIHIPYIYIYGEKYFEQHTVDLRSSYLYLLIVAHLLKQAWRMQQSCFLQPLTFCIFCLMSPIHSLTLPKYRRQIWLLQLKQYWYCRYSFDWQNCKYKFSFCK